jgi:pilus assembly protein TadC
MWEVYSLASILMNKRDKFVELSKGAADAALGRSKSLYFSRDNITAIMSKYGLMYMLKDYRLEPAFFILVKLGFAIVCLVVGAVVCGQFGLAVPAVLALAIVLGLFGFFVPDLLLKASNQNDNLKMQNDLVGVFSTLKIHARAGVYISDTLVECQRIVANPRLKEAFTELNNNILSRRVTVADAVDIFNSRFDNDQIDNLSVIIKQTLRTGRSTDMIADISKQIEDANKARSMAQRDRLKRKVALIQTIFFCMITVLVLYLVIMQMYVSIQDL